MGKRWKTYRIVAAATVLALGLTGTAVTFASVKAVSNAVVNSFEAGEVKTSIEEEFEGTVEKNKTVKKNLAVRNEGRSNAYIRARITVSPEKDLDVTLLHGSWVNGSFTSEGTALAVNAGGFYDPDGDGVGWYAGTDGWFYYSAPVEPGTVTETLFDAVKIGEVSGDFDITVYQEAVYSSTDAAGTTMPLEHIVSFFDAVNSR